MREIILDTETTGKDPIAGGHKIIEIGAIEMVEKIYTGREFHVYLNPQRDIDPEAYKKHGISLSFLKDKPLFSKIAKDFLRFIDGAKIVAHNARFDMRFINHELSLIGEPPINMDIVIDTLALARRKFPGSPAKLDDLCKRFKIDNSSRHFHGALLDAKLLAEVYIELTGGRQTKFEIIDSEKKLTGLIKTVKSKENKNFIKTTKVIEPTKEDIRLHKEFLKRIKNPLWLHSYQ